MVMEPEITMEMAVVEAEVTKKLIPMIMMRASFGSSFFFSGDISVCKTQVFRNFSCFLF
jgi:hypothetical protein